MLDEIGIKRGIQRLPNGVTRGYVNTGTFYEKDCDDVPLAKDAVVFMIVGLDEKWKFPIAYFLINGLESAVLVELIKESLCRLHEIGVEVVSITLDGPNQHVYVLEQLGVSFQMSDLKPYFSHPSNDKRVYAILDPCHMLKLMRNLFGDLKILVDPDSNLIRWEFIKNLVKIQEAEGLREIN